MRKFLPLLFFLLFYQLVSAQDIIVTNEGDTIDCKITRITNEFLHFTVYDDSGIILMRSRLPLAAIQYYEQREVREEPVEQPEPNPPPSIPEEEQPVLGDYEPPQFRLALNGGFTYQFGGYDGAPDSYKQQMQTLWNFDGELHYLTPEGVGIGFKYSYIFTKADQDFISGNGSVTQFRDELVRFHYAGLSVMYRKSFYDQAVQYFLSGGVLNYKTDLLIDGQPFYQRGESFGVIFGISYDFQLLKSVGTGIGAQILIANISEMDNNGNNISTDFNVSRIDITLGIRLYQ